MFDFARPVLRAKYLEINLSWHLHVSYTREIEGHRMSKRFYLKPNANITCVNCDSLANTHSLKDSRHVVENSAR